jgi:hypothetical protein
MKWIAFIGELAGFISSILLAWGYQSPTGFLMRDDGKPNTRERQARRELAIKIGFVALSLSFLAQAIATWESN